MFDRLERLLTEWEPRRRRRFALHLVVWSAVAGIVNVILFVAGVITETHLILVTLGLSWLALTFAAAEMVLTTDVRAEG